MGVTDGERVCSLKSLFLNGRASLCFTETLYQESGGEYAVMSNEERQMEVQFFFPISITLTPIIKLLVDNTPPPKLAFRHPASEVKLGTAAVS